MRRTLMLLSTMVLALLLAGGLALVAVSPAARADGDCQPSGSEVVCTFNYTGAAQSWTVPEGITQATFDVFGAQGGREPLGKPGGGGGLAHATIDVTPGDTHQVNVGGAGTGGAGFAVTVMPSWMRCRPSTTTLSLAVSPSSITHSESTRGPTFTFLNATLPLPSTTATL